MKKGRLQFFLLWSIWIGMPINNVVALERNSVLIRSLYRESYNSSHVTTVIWEFKPALKKGLIDVYVKDRSDKVLTIHYDKNGRLQGITKTVSIDKGQKEITINNRNPITLSEGFATPYDYLAPFNDDLKQIEISKQAGGVSFSTLYTRSIEKLTMKAALQLEMIDRKRAAVFSEKELAQELRLISIYKGNSPVVRQLWAPDEEFWIFEETPLRKSWNITPK